MKSKTKSSCGCGGGPQTSTIVVVETMKKRKRQPQTPTILKKTQLQLEAEQRKKNGSTMVNTMVEKAKRQSLQKYPTQQNVLSVPKHKGIFFPPKEDTPRILNRQKVKKQVSKLIKDVRSKHKEATTKWKQTPSETWTKNKK